MGIASILFGIAQLADIVVGFTSKHPETAPHFAPVVGSLIESASRTAGETEEQTAARIAAHDAVVKLYAAGPPPGANLGAADLRGGGGGR